MPEQNPKVNIEASAEAVKRKMQGYRDSLMRGVLSLTKHWQKRGDIVSNNFALGMTYLKSGHVRDAVMRFKIVTWMEPTRADAWYYLGCSYLAIGERPEAQKALSKSLQLKAGDEEATYMLAMASGQSMPAAKRPKKMPLSLSLSHFEARAAGFTREQLETYSYQGHTVLANAIRAAAVPGRIDHVILEMGVGTGLMGPLVRDIAAHITGVDMSAAMLNEAMNVVDGTGKKIYDALINRELMQFLPEVTDNAFDIVIAAGLVSYMGELDALFAQVSRVMKPGGLFALTADKLDGQDFQLDPDIGRFRFSHGYLEGLARANKLKTVKFEEAEIYPDYKTWLCVFAK